MRALIPAAWKEQPMELVGRQGCSRTRLRASKMAAGLETIMSQAKYYEAAERRARIVEKARVKVSSPAARREEPERRL
jgi:hypothetical protein